MLKIDHDASADVVTDDRRGDASARFETSVRRCQRLRHRSRSAVRARIRLGLMIGLAIALLVVLALQGSLQWIRLDATSLLTSGAALIGGLAAAYIVALLALGAFVKRRRVSRSKAPCQSVAPSA